MTVGAVPAPAPVTVTAPARSGGRLLVMLAFAAMFCSGPGQSFLISVFVDDLLGGTGLSRTAFSGVYAGATVFAAVLGLMAGRLADAIGLRTIWVVAAVGLALACFVASVAGGIVLAAVSLSLLRAFGHTTFPLVGTLLANQSVRQRRGAAIAAASFGMSAAAIALPPLVTLLIDGVGWRASFRIIGLVVLAATPVAFAIRPTAAALAARAHGARPAAQAHGAAPVLPRARLPRRRRRHERGPSVVDRSALLLLVAFAPLPLVGTGITFHAVSLLGGRGLDRPAAALALSSTGIAAAASAVLALGFIDRLRTPTLLVAMSVTLVAATLLVLVPVGVLAYPGFVLMGLSVTLFTLASGVAWARTYGLAGLGRRQGISFAVISGSAAAGPLPMSISHSVTGGYGAGLLVLVACAVVGVLAAVRWREPSPGAARAD